MAHKRVDNNDKRAARAPRRSGAGSQRIRVEPARRERVDPQMIALCYWLLAQRIVQEADEAAPAAAERCRDSTTPNDVAGPDDSSTEARS